jgi:hypothetical protein
VIRYDDLVSASPAVGDEPLVRVAATDEPEEAFGVLAVVFGQQETLERCRLQVGDEVLGAVERTTVLDLLTTGTKGLGAGDGLRLPGLPPSAQLTLLVCPVDGCEAGSVLVSAYDEDDPPTCPSHPGVALILRP